MAFMGILLVNLIFGILSGVFFLGAVCLAIGLIIREKYKLIAKILFIVSRDEKSRTFSSNSQRSHILRTSSRSIRLILSSIVSLAVWLKWTRTI